MHDLLLKSGGGPEGFFLPENGFEPNEIPISRLEFFNDLAHDLPLGSHISGRRHKKGDRFHEKNREVAAQFLSHKVPQSHQTK